MTTDHHRERRELNALARALLVADGTLDGPVARPARHQLPGRRRGDRPAGRTAPCAPDGAADRDFVRTGGAGQVVEVHLGKELADSAVVVDFDRRGQVVVDHGHLTHRVDPASSAAWPTATP